MDLLQRMLQKRPEQRLSSEEALKHPAFSAVLSSSPLVVKNLFDPNDLIQHTLLTEE